MSEIQWDRLHDELYEDMVCCLLSHLNPKIKRIDGRGGDKGRDAQFRGEQFEIFELKYFPARVGKSQRAQVKKSLDTAAKLQPDSWTLVLPTEFTPGELEWFEKLTKDRPFSCDWWGRAKLNAFFSERPFISRYFLEDEQKRVIELLKELNQEQAVISGGIPEGLARIETLARKIDELDPFYAYDISVVNRVPSVTVRPRYEGAEEDRPLLIDFALRFDDSDTGKAAAKRFQEFLDFGTPVEVEDENIGVVSIRGMAGADHSFEGGYLKLGPSESESFELKLRLAIVDQLGSPLVEIPITCTERTHGVRGFVVSGADPSGMLSVTFRIDASDLRGSFHFSYSLRPDALPHDVLPILRVLRQLRPPNRVVVKDAISGSPTGNAVPIQSAIDVPEDFLTFVEKLFTIQTKTNCYFPIPEEMSPKDLREFDEAYRLLSGEMVSQRWTSWRIELERGGFESIRPFVERDEPMALYRKGEIKSQIAGNDVFLGISVFQAPSARVTNRDEVLAAINGEDVESVQVLFEPANDDRASLQLDSFVDAPPLTEGGDDAPSGC